MSLRKVLLSFVHLLVLLSLVTAGVFFLLLPFLPNTRLKLIAFLTYDYTAATWIGIGCFLVAALFLGVFYSLHRGRYLLVRMGISANLKLIQQATEECFFREFTKQVSLKDLAVGAKSRLEFTIRLSQVEAKDQEEVLLRVEKHLANLLQRRFGYTKDFYTVVSRSPESSSIC